MTAPGDEQHRARSSSACRFAGPERRVEPLGLLIGLLRRLPARSLVSLNRLGRGGRQFAADTTTHTIAVPAILRPSPSVPEVVAEDREFLFRTRRRFPSVSPDGRWVLYVGRAAGNDDICLQSVSGETAINLTRDSSASDTMPAFSPDGDSIAFSSDRDGGGIFLMDRTGESARRLTRFGCCASWFPDGGQNRVLNRLLAGATRVPNPSQ